jgi:hypothetical protein
LDLFEYQIGVFMGSELTISNGNGSMLVPSNIEQAMKLADMMSGAKLVPVHLQGKPADCLLVIEQAARWKMSPFAVAQSTSVIQGKLMYEGKLVAAVVNANGNLAERLSYAYEGAGDTRKVIVSGRCEGEKAARTVEVALRDARTANKVWNTQPDQQLMYHGARVWARRHMPELMLGVYSPEEFDDNKPMVDITPSEIDHSKPASLFKTAAARKTFQANVTDSFHKAQSHAELTTLMELDKAKFTEMEASGDERDELSLGEIRKQFQIAWNRLVKSAPADDDSALDEEEVPPYVKQQMEEEKERLAAQGLAL